MVRRKGRKTPSGILLVNKPKGISSAGVVAKIKARFRLAKVGHAGTLDPAAMGLLPICVNEATKIAGYLSDKGKEYQAVMKLGVVTDTQDGEGNVISESPVDVSENEIEKAVKSFIGTFEQLPPMFSAKKVDGKTLYKLAREGKEVERKAVEITVENIDLHKIDLPHVTFSVAAQKGFYVRTLCHDIGQKLEVGAHMTSLLRTRHGSFKLADSIEFEKLLDEGEDCFIENLMSLGADSIDIPKIEVNKVVAEYLLNGRQVPVNIGKNCDIPGVAKEGDLLRAMLPNDRIVALIRLEAGAKKLQSGQEDSIMFSVVRGFSPE